MALHSLSRFGQEDFAFGEFASADFFEHLDKDFGLGEIWVGMKAGFDQPEFEEFFGDGDEFDIGIVGVGFEFGNLSLDGALVAPGFEGVFANAKAAESGFAGGEVCADWRREKKFVLNLFEGVFLKKTEDEEFEIRIESIKADAKGRTSEFEKGRAILFKANFVGVWKELVVDSELGSIREIAEFLICLRKAAESISDGSFCGFSACFEVSCADGSESCRT
jgi:hypothetical protein